MNTMTRLFLIACLALPFAGCKKAEAPVEEVSAPLSAPTTDDKVAWQAYLSDVVMRNMGNISNQPYAYFLPAESTPDFDAQYNRLLEKAQGDVARGVMPNNLLAYGSPSSNKMADLVVAAFTDVEADTLKGVKLVFVGKAEDGERVKAAVAPAGVDYVFVEAK